MEETAPEECLPATGVEIGFIDLCINMDLRVSQLPLA
jgi:hypothetical protein